MGESTTTVTDAPTGTEVRVVTVPASASPGGGVQQVASIADGLDGSLMSIRPDGSVDVNISTSASPKPITSGQLTGSGVAVTANTAESATAAVAIINGTFTNLPITFEGTIDGTTWHTLVARRADRPVNIFGIVTLTAAGALLYRLDVGNLQQIRVRQTAAASTQTANPTVIITQSALGPDPAPTSTEAQPTDSVIYYYAAATTATTLLNANARRRAMSVYNDSTSLMYLSLNATVSTSIHTVQIPSGGLYEAPFPCYTGPVTAMWVTANGAARVTEYYS